MEDKYNPEHFNLRQSQNFFISTNKDHYKLHFRTFLFDTPGPLNGIILYIHGYGGHCARKSTMLQLCQYFHPNRYAVFAIDLLGHGYSEGTRAYIQDWTHLLNDIKAMIQIIYSNQHTYDYYLDFDYEVWEESLYNAPLFVMGQSMGGALTLHLALQSLHPSETILQKLRGIILIAPAIDIIQPPTIVTWLLKYLIVPLFPEKTAPESLLNVDLSSIWNTEEKRQIGFNDKWDETQEDSFGLRWSQPIRFKTADSILTMLQELNENMHKINVPYLLFHDPEDKICPFQGSERFHNTSSTLNEHKTFITMENAAHDILFNEGETIVPRIVEWIQQLM